MALKGLLSTALFFFTTLSPSYSSPTKHSSPPPDYRLFSLPDIPGGGRQEHAAVFLPPDTIAIVGGITPDESAKVSPFSSTDLVQFYSITDETWRTVAPLPRRLNHANVAVVDSKIYVLGGFDDGGDDRERLRAVSDSWMYDPATDTWSSLPPLDVARAAAAVAEFDGKIYVAGGFTQLVLTSQVALPTSQDHVSVFDTTTETWVTDSLPEKARTLPEPRDHARTAVVDGKMYVIGGFDVGAFNQLDTVFVLDLHNLEAGWETGPARMPTRRGTFASGVIGKKIFAIGGEGNITTDGIINIITFNEVEAYDVESKTWTRFSPLSTKRQAPGVGVDGKVYIPGGMGKPPADPLIRFDVFVPCDSN